MTDDLPIAFDAPVTLVGAGALSRDALVTALDRAPRLVAADGAADRLAQWGIAPDAVIGDMDSISDGLRAAPGSAIVRHLPEQETTDFEKCLYATEAPWYLGVGFTGGRLDHTLAVLHAMLARPEKQVIMLGERDAAVFARPGRVLEMTLAEGAVVSIFPLRPVTGVISEGLEWPVDGMFFAPGEHSGTSNRATGAPFRLSFDAPGALVMVAADDLDALIGTVLAED
ncbi:MAG: thiamine diphosphokinase [Pseudomonadota bacterium]